MVYCVYIRYCKEDYVFEIKSPKMTRDYCSTPLIPWIKLQINLYEKMLIYYQKLFYSPDPDTSKWVNTRTRRGEECISCCPSTSSGLCVLLCLQSHVSTCITSWYCLQCSISHFIISSDYSHCLSQLVMCKYHILRLSMLFSHV